MNPGGTEIEYILCLLSSTKPKMTCTLHMTIKLPTCSSFLKIAKILDK